MEVVKVESSASYDGVLPKIVEILKDGGLVCLPCNGTYRIFADLRNEEAVMRLFQTKRRVHKAPSLVFIDSIARLCDVTDQVDARANTLMKATLPGPVTILFAAGTSLPRRVIKELTRANGKLGVRIPQNSLSHRVVEAFGGPVLVSSANRGRKSGETSPAQVRKNFGRGVDYFLDAGELQAVPASTVIDVEKNQVDIIRKGAVTEKEIEEILAAAIN